MVTQKDQIELFVKGAIESGSVRVSREPGSNLVFYIVTNINDPDIVGKLFFTDSGEVAYCEVEGLTNRQYEHGEYLDKGDISKFVNTVHSERAVIKRGLFGSRIIQFTPSNLKFNKKI